MSDDARQRRVGDEPRRVERHPPRVEQPVQIGADGVGRVAQIGFDLRKRVDQDDQIAAAHDVLVDGVQRFVAEMLGVHQQQNVDVVRNVQRLARNEPHVENVAHDVHDRPAGIVFRIDQLRFALSVDGQSADDADGRAFGTRQVGQVFCDVVFQKPFARRIQHRDGAASVGRIGNRQSDVDVFLRIADGNAFQSVAQGFVLFFGKRFGVDDFQSDFAV